MMNADGGNPRNLTKNFERGCWEPSWSPTGKHIAFYSATQEDGAEIYVMDANGKNPQNLTNNPLANDSEPEWYRPAFAVAPADKQFTMWGWLKQVVR
jgi:Tol biopolymer transport system component